MIVAVFVQFADPPLRRHLFANMVRAERPVAARLHAQAARIPRRPADPRHPVHEAMLREAQRFAGSAEIIGELNEYEAEIREGTGHSGRFRRSWA
ncbi:MAG: hypothetical protein U1F25_02200 [Rubrivivax sp.]